MADGGGRVMALLAVSALALVVCAIRLIDLQAVQADELAGQALDQRLRTVTIQASRGSIVDAQGEPLAVTTEARNVTADQRMIENPAAVALELAPILGLDANKLSARLTGTRPFVYVAKEISTEDWRRIEGLDVPGIFSEPASKRIYPGGDLAANVIGFVGADGSGLGGIEYAYEDVLAGQHGQETSERGPGGRLIPTSQRSLVDAQPGSNVRLTLDRDIQFMAQEAIAAQVARSRSDSGTVVVIDPATGKILALATAPTFDANRVGSAPEALRGNRALSDVYEPGSTNKVATIAAAIDQGVVNVRTPFTIPPQVKRGPESFRDHDGSASLRLTLAGVMAKSSNGGTIFTAERLGGRRFYDYLRKFGIGEPTGLVFPGESSGHLPRLKDWNVSTLPTIAFGQGLSVNAVQAAMIQATIANDGVRVPPRLVDAIIEPDGRVSEVPQASGIRVVKASTARTVRSMLEMVVSDEGTAPTAAIPGYRVAGKTGTAQYIDPSCGCYNGGVIASFIGMAPADAPALVVAVTLVNPQQGRYGGEIAAPVFKKVMTYGLQARKIPPTGTRSTRLELLAG